MTTTEKKTELPKKTYRLNQIDQECLNGIMDEYSFKTENEAVKYVIQTHLQMQKELRLIGSKNAELENDLMEVKQAIQEYFEGGVMLKKFIGN